ncbi:MAG: MFS transporter [Ectothiorhodospiraceae bacterium]|nr:MFS transporter [Chromatiales bacterium]MCP5153858.1 MFS transporter [Ectothiorhodospiraceae bacterium]
MPAWYPVTRLIVALVLMTIGGAGMYSSVLVLEPAAVEFGTGRGLGSMPYAFFMVGFGLGGVFMGRLADRFGILVPAFIGSAALPLGFALASGAGSMLEFCLILGAFSGFLGASFVFAPLVSDISHWFHARRGLAVGIVISGSYMAGALWPPILQHWFDLQGWRETFADLAWVTGCSLLPLSLALAPRPPTSHAVGGGGRPVVVGARPLGFTPNMLQCLVCVAGIGCCVAMAVPQVHIVPYVLDLGHPAARGAEMLSLMLGFGVVSRVVSGWLSDRIGGLRALLVGSSLQALVLVAFLGADTLVSLYAVSIAFGLSQGGIVPSYAIIVRTFFPPGEAGWRIGAALLFTIGGMALGGWMAGALFDLTGSYTVPFVNAIAFNVLNMAIAALLLARFTRAARAAAAAA